MERLHGHEEHKLVRILVSVLKKWTCPSDQEWPVIQTNLECSLHINGNISN